MIRFSSYQLPVLDAGGQYLLFIIYYGRWLDIIEKTFETGKFLYWCLEKLDNNTPTNITAKNGSRLTVVEADDGAEHFLRARSGILSAGRLDIMP